MLTAPKQVDHWLRRLACWLALAFPAATIGGHALADIVGSTVAALFLLHVLLMRDWQIFSERWVRFGLTYWLFITLSALWAYDPMLALKSGFIWGRFLWFGLALAYWVLTDEAIQKRFFVMVAAVLAFYAIDGIIQYYRGVDLFGQIKYNQYANKNALGQVKPGDRLTGPFRRPILAALIVSLMFPLLMVVLRGDAQKRQRLVLGLIAAGCIYVVIIAGERAQFLLMFLGLAITGLVFWRQHNPQPLLLCVAAAIAMIAVQALLLDKWAAADKQYVIQRQIYSTWHILSDPADSPYGMIWKDALATAMQHPIGGVGEGNIRVYWCDLRQQVFYTSSCPLHPHNTYLEQLASSGLVGLGLYLLMLANLAQYFWQKRRAWRQNAVTLGIVIALAVRCWPLISVTSYTHAMSSFPLWMLVGWGVGRVRQQSLLQS